MTSRTLKLVTGALVLGMVLSFHDTHWVYAWIALPIASLLWVVGIYTDPDEKEALNSWKQD
jgi:hypothetical protein